MKLDNLLTFGSPQPGKLIIQSMTELDVSNKQIPKQQYQNRLKSKAMRLFLRLKISCHNAHILEYINDSSKKCRMLVFAHFMLFVLKPKEIL